MASNMWDRVTENTANFLAKATHEEVDRVNQLGFTLVKQGMKFTGEIITGEMSVATENLGIENQKTQQISRS